MLNIWWVTKNEQNNWRTQLNVFQKLSTLVVFLQVISEKTWQYTYGLLVSGTDQQERVQSETMKHYKVVRKKSVLNAPKFVDFIHPIITYFAHLIDVLDFARASRWLRCTIYYSQLSDNYQEIKQYSDRKNMDFYFLWWLNQQLA